MSSDFWCQEKLPYSPSHTQPLPLPVVLAQDCWQGLRKPQLDWFWQLGDGEFWEVGGSQIE